MLDLRDDHLDGDGIVPATRHDHVRVPLARLDELQVHGLDRLQVLCNDLVQRAPSLLHVSPQAANQSDVRIRVDEDLHVTQISQLRIGEQQDTVEYENVSGLDALGSLAARV